MAQQDLGTLDDYEDVPQDSLGTLDDYEDVGTVSRSKGQWLFSGGPDDSAPEEDKLSYIITRTKANPTMYSSQEGQEGLTFDEGRALDEITSELQSRGIKTVGAQQILDMIKSDNLPKSDAEYRQMMKDLTSEAKASGAITKGNYLAPNFTAGSDKGSLIGKAANLITDIAEGPTRALVAGAQMLTTPLDVVKHASASLGAEPEDSAQPYVPQDVAMEAAKPDWMAEHGTAREIGSFITPGLNMEGVALPLLKGFKNLGGKYLVGPRPLKKLEEILSNAGAITETKRQQLMMEAEAIALGIKKRMAKEGDGKAMQAFNNFWQRMKPMLIKKTAEQAPLVGAQMTKDITTPEVSQEKVAGDVLGAGLGLGVGTGLGMWSNRLFNRELKQGLRLGDLGGMADNPSVAQGGTGAWFETNLVPQMKQRSNDLLKLHGEIRKAKIEMLQGKQPIATKRDYVEFLNFLKGEQKKAELLSDAKKVDPKSLAESEALKAQYATMQKGVKDILSAFDEPTKVKITPLDLTDNAAGLGKEPPAEVVPTTRDPETLDPASTYVEDVAHTFTESSGKFAKGAPTATDMEKSNLLADISANLRTNFLSGKSPDYAILNEVHRVLNETQALSPFKSNASTQTGSDIDIGTQLLAYAHANANVSTGASAKMLNELTAAGRNIESMLKKYNIEVPAWLKDEEAMKQFGLDLRSISHFNKLKEGKGKAGEALTLRQSKELGYQLLAVIASQATKGASQRPIETQRAITEP